MRARPAWRPWRAAARSDRRVQAADQVRGDGVQEAARQRDLDTRGPGVARDPPDDDRAESQPLVVGDRVRRGPGRHGRGVPGPGPLAIPLRERATRGGPARARVRLVGEPVEVDDALPHPPDLPVAGAECVLGAVPLHDLHRHDGRLPPMALVVLARAIFGLSRVGARIASRAATRTAPGSSGAQNAMRCSAGSRRRAAALARSAA
jgi:hypothetical protein